MLNFQSLVGCLLSLWGIATFQNAAYAAEEYPLTGPKAGFQSALQRSAELLKRDPADANALAVQAWAFDGLGKPDEAVIACNKALKLDPTNQLAYRTRGSAELYLCKYGEALADCDKAIALNSKDPYAYGLRGNICSWSEKYQLGIEACDNAIQLKPDYARAYRYRASCYANLFQVQQTLNDCNASIALGNTDDGWVYEHRSWANCKIGNYQSAIEDCTKEIVCFPEDSWSYRKRGWAAGQIGLYQEEVTDSSRAIELDPRWALPYINRAYAKGQLGNFRQSITDYDIAIRLAPNYTPAYRNRAFTHRMLGEYYQALMDEIMYELLYMRDRGGSYTIGILLVIAGFLSVISAMVMRNRNLTAERKLMYQLLIASDRDRAMSLLDQLINQCLQNGRRRRADSLSQSMLSMAEGAPLSKDFGLTENASIRDIAPKFLNSLLCYGLAALILGGTMAVMFG